MKWELGENLLDVGTLKELLKDAPDDALVIISSKERERPVASAVREAGVLVGKTTQFALTNYENAFTGDHKWRDG